MPTNKKPGPSVKDQTLYEDLRDEGNSRAKSARIANAAANSSSRPSASTVESRPRTTTGPSAIYDCARLIGIGGRSPMNKTQLIRAAEELTDHACESDGSRLRN